MRRFRLTLTFILLLLAPVRLVSAQDQTAPEAEIISLTAGEAIRGVVPVTGNTAIDGFRSWELTFGYASDTTGTWFFINEGDEPIINDTLTQWDTTTLTDGTYNLRLTVYLEGGRRTHFIVPDLRVRNYTPIETDTPTPTLTSTPHTLTPEASSTPSITPSSTATALPITPTPLPTNPLGISSNDISNSLMRGVAGAIAIFVLIGLYTSIRRTLRR